MNIAEERQFRQVLVDVSALKAAVDVILEHIAKLEEQVRAIQLLRDENGYRQRPVARRN